MRKSICLVAVPAASTLTACTESGSAEIDGERWDLWFTGCEPGPASPCPAFQDRQLIPSNATQTDCDAGCACHFYPVTLDADDGGAAATYSTRFVETCSGIALTCSIAIQGEDGAGTCIETDAAGALIAAPQLTVVHAVD